MKKTKKELILEYVETTFGATGARFTDIQKFIYEHNHPGKTYGRNNRGYYCCALWDGGMFAGRKGHLVKGDNRLEKMSNGRWKVVRAIESKKPTDDEYNKAIEYVEKLGTLDSIYDVAMKYNLSAEQMKELYVVRERALHYFH
tara:strand:+ start:566 stop:994 length:429 start_codon:yes stop_codon:yes gene_type:complete